MTATVTNVYKVQYQIMTATNPGEFLGAVNETMCLGATEAAAVAVLVADLGIPASSISIVSITEESAADGNVHQ